MAASDSAIVLPEMVDTADGSPSLLDEETGELFHNRAGAYSEAYLHYVNPSGALSRLAETAKLKVLDVCFGLAYNSFVLFEESTKAGLSGEISIHAIEMNGWILDFLPRVLAYEKFRYLASALDPVELKEKRKVAFQIESLSCEIHLDLSSIQKSLPSVKGNFDFVFHDPFSPKRMPELWTLEIFSHYFELLKQRNGAVLTYSSAGAVRGGLLESGFQVEKTEAVGAKNGGTLAFVSSKSKNMLASSLTAEELKRLAGPSGVPYRDESFQCDREALVQRRLKEQQARLPFRD
ncbi:MAG: hypothetical protein K2X27_28035 [Candidatus Obscuribacterales bacterium]|nr:hypothetical protein [Candidatus Obscuribacterales bacterium]